MCGSLQSDINLHINLHLHKQYLAGWSSMAALKLNYLFGPATPENSKRST